MTSLRITHTCSFFLEQNFSVKWEKNHLADSLAPRSSCAYIYLDGKQTGGRILDRGDCTATVSGVSDSLTSERPYAFAQIVSTFSSSLPSFRQILTSHPSSVDTA